MIPIFRPSMGEEEIKAVSEVLKSGWIGLGPKTKEFEEKFAEYIGVKYAVALNSCTAALQLALKILNLKKGEEVITTPLTFISTAFAADYNNLKPVFADIKEDTLNIDPEDVKRKLTKKTKVILPVHFGGHPCDMDELYKIAEKYNLTIIEDAAHACGSEYKGNKIGSISKLSCFSFHAVKNLAMGDGGMITTNDKEIYERLIRLRWLGIDKSTFNRNKENYSWDYDINEIGFKCHVNDISSAIGLVQLKKLEKNNEKRRNIFKKYNEAFKDVKEIETPLWKGDIKSACHNYVAKVENRDELIQYLAKNDISSGVHYKPLYLHPVYKHIKAECPITDRIWKKLILLPLYPDMKNEEINKVINCIKEFYSNK